MRSKPFLSWTESIDEFKRTARRSPKLAAARNDFLARARRILKLPLVRRVYRYSDIGRHRTWLDGRAVPIKEPAHTIFALAMSDHAANSLLASELPTLAAAARLTGDRTFARRVCDQLHEMAAWSPLQRPGWTTYGGHLPPDGRDGNWLATGTGVRAIADTFEIMGRDDLPPATVARLDQLLAAEIVSIVDDWLARRPWFVKSNSPLTNQWVLPTEGLVRACLVLGRERHAAAYETGVANLKAHLDAHGAQGAFEEGIHYADFTVRSLIAAARAMALAGDRRAIDHHFLRRFPMWALHHFQPGGFFVNPFDATGAARGNKNMMRGMLALAAICLGNRDALWALDRLAGGPDSSLEGLLAHILPRSPARPAPAPYGFYTRAMRVNWRSNWTDRATGVWVRGGDPHDSHDHIDRGHVNLILRGEPVFIEAGTPAYHNPRLATDYASGRGHNILQLGSLPPPQKRMDYVVQPGWQKPHARAPIAVRRLDRLGGDITVDGTAGYDGLDRWIRRVSWDAARLQVVDRVVLPGDKPQVVLFRWHLGTTRKPSIRITGSVATVAWSGIRLEINADTPLALRCEAMPDHTMAFRKWDDKRPDHLHTCLIVQTTGKVNSCRILISAKRQ